ENGKRLLHHAKTFMDLLLPSEREKAYQFLIALTNREKTDISFLHMIDGGLESYRYRGKQIDEGFILVGITTGKAHEEESLTFSHGFNERIFRALDVGVLILNKQNRVVYKNAVLESFEKRVYKNLEESYPIVKKISEMADTIRKSKEDVQRYHIYDDQLYRVYGLFNEWDDSIIFVVDDRAASDDYDQLLRYKQQMESVSHLAAGFAHELRNPLSVIRGFIQLSGLTDNLKKYYGTILSEIERMNRIIEDFLSLSRKVPQKEYIEPYTFFQSVIALIRSECLLRDIQLEYSFEKVPDSIYANRSMIIQVILNLLRNAIEAFPADQLDKRFTIESRSVDGEYEVIIKDNGPGMEDSVLKQIGKPFFTTKENGTGIGLPLCKKIIHDHGGRFDIDSILGKGTKISLRLPFTAKEEDKS
ncbi:MAG TPA: HAMP domain-containing sensor histidine kinase, partial [Sporolactobacillaceae bacterium]|nr:HAMP domain-containing sensor histidine kinase [Sporolactobacillaceae bacterium]